SRRTLTLSPFLISLSLHDALPIFLNCFLFALCKQLTNSHEVVIVDADCLTMILEGGLCVTVRKINHFLLVVIFVQNNDATCIFLDRKSTRLNSSHVSI